MKTTLVDIETRIEQARSLVKDFFKLDSIDEPRITWGDKSKKFPTNDPFKRVRIKANRVVLREEVGKNTIWHIDMVKGLLCYFLPPNLRDTWSGWNLSTLIALSLIPSSQVTDSQKSQYRKLWINLNKKIKRYQERFNYERWYKILSNYPRVQLQSLFQDFIKFFEEIDTTQDHPENILNHYLQNLQGSFQSQLEIDIVCAALKHQTIDVKSLQEFFEEVSETTIYRSLGNLIFQLNEFYMIIPSQIGLSSIYVISDQHLFLTEINNFPYYENIETFREDVKPVVKCWIPLLSEDELLAKLPHFNRRLTVNENSQRQENYRIIRRYFEQSKFRVNPYLFDVRTETWKSFQEEDNLKEKTIEVKLPIVKTNKKIKAEEIQIAKAMLLSRTSDYRKLSVYKSQSKTKRLVKKVLEKDILVPLVFWRKPNLPTVLVILPLSNWETHTIDQIDILNFESALYEEIVDQPWPYISIEYGIEYQYQNQILMSRKLAFFRISAVQKDLEWISSRTQIYGTYVRPTGTNPNFPVDKFTEEGWDFDIDYFIELLEN